MKHMIWAMLLFALGARFVSADTLSFTDHGSIINGKITFSLGVFQLEGNFGGANQKMSVKPSRVGGIRFNAASDNPAGARELHDVGEPKPNEVQVSIRLWSSEQKHEGVLEEITSDAITIRVGASPETFKTSDVEELRVQH
jgi:hypothetical protein